MASSPASSLARTVSIAASCASALASVLAALVLGVSPGGNGDVAQFFGRFHPLVVHLPIGAVVLVVALEVAAVFYREPTRYDGTLDLALPLSTASAAASFVLGLLLAGGGGYPPSTVAWHRALTLAAIVLLAAVSVVFALATQERREGGRTPYRALLAGTLLVLSVGAHYGGTLSRGEGYLTRYAPDTVRRWLGETIEVATPAEPPRVGEEPLIFAEVVVPVMNRTCVSCHGPKEAKGKLRLDSLEAMQKGGDDGPAVLPGQGSKSPLYARMALPLADDDHMPPADHPQPTDAERELVRFWIDRGATETLRVVDALPPVETRALLESAAAARAKPAAAEPTPTATRDASVAPSAAPSAEPEAPPVASPAPRPPPANGEVLADVVMPILRARCESCHGAAKQKGKLRVDSLAALLAGGKEGPAVIAGSSATSPLIQRIHLPLSDDKHMPPPKSPQPADSEVRALVWWIDQGAKADTKVSAMPAALRGAPKPAPAPPASAEPSPTPSASPPPAPVSEGPTQPLPATVRWEADVVMPLLASRCGSCHGGAKPEGGLSFDDRAATFRGGDSGPAIVPGAPEKSSLLQRVKLPESDEEHMPPSSFTQLTAGEVALLEAWIRAGAVEGTLETAGLPNDQKSALAALLPPPAEPVAAVTPTVAGAPPRASGPPPVPPTSGCAACAIGAVTGGLLPLSSAAALLVLLLGRRVSARGRR